MALVETEKHLYELEFNPELDVYEDKSPISKYERNSIEFVCLCKINSSFITFSQYNRHINLDIHKRYKDNFKFFNKPLLDCRGLLIDLKRENHLSLNQIRSLKVKYADKKKKIIELENKMNDNKNLQKDYDLLKMENERLKKDLEEIDTTEISDSDDEFTDCR
tara:strand:+ start:2168 stop:2656 length:489 start_codon:yes stop_codon:yes gene_type:complete